MESQSAEQEMDEVFRNVRRGVFVRTLELFGEVSFDEGTFLPVGNEYFEDGSEGPYKVWYVFINNKEIGNFNVDYSSCKNREICYDGVVPFYAKSKQNITKLMCALFPSERDFSRVDLRYNLETKVREDDYEDILFP